MGPVPVVSAPIPESAFKRSCISVVTDSPHFSGKMCLLARCLPAAYRHSQRDLAHDGGFTTSGRIFRWRGGLSQERVYTIGANSCESFICTEMLVSVFEIVATAEKGAYEERKKTNAPMTMPMMRLIGMIALRVDGAELKNKAQAEFAADRGLRTECLMSYQ